MTSPCVGCLDCTLYPDGSMRCDINMHLAIDSCPSINPGHFKAFKPEMKKKVQEVIEGQKRASRTREKVRGSPAKKKAIKEQGKLF